MNGRLDVGTYTAESRADPAVQELTRKVSYEVKPYDGGGSFPGGTRILTTDGRVLEADFPYQLGAPENPMSADQVRAKFRGQRRRCARHGGDRGVRGADLLARAPGRPRECLLAAFEACGGRLMATVLSVEQREIVATVREFVEKEVMPVASEYEHADEYPTPLVEQMKELGLFGVTIPTQYDGPGSTSRPMR